jgi:tripartite-type tricarboxylate transporter receptor subunit TctC
LIVPFATGGATDLYARTLGAALSVELGQQIVVEARPGAGGLTGVDVLAKSPPDGYTLCLAGVAALSAIPFMVTKMPFDWQKDLALISLVVRVPEVAVVNQASRCQHLAGVRRPRPQQSRQNQFWLRWRRLGHAPWCRAVEDGSQNRPRPRAVPRRGPAITDLLGNHIQLLISDAPVIASSVHSGKLKALATTSEARSVLLPDVPRPAKRVIPK